MVNPIWQCDQRRVAGIGTHFNDYLILHRKSNRRLLTRVKPLPGRAYVRLVQRRACPLAIICPNTSWQSPVCASKQAINFDHAPVLGSAELLQNSAASAQSGHIQVLTSDSARRLREGQRTIGRPLLGAFSMGHTILVDFETFETEILGVTPSLAAIAALPDKLVNHARLVFDAVFRRPDPPTEDAIAKQFIEGTARPPTGPRARSTPAST
ncbi:hypothetical protein NUW54_g13617 [Trametes sanguinea]|uniref:Uncharacterized protein n=1 Tax=Trametes sanguinea TaxID=158606 RepID=A0ACC1MKK4_9APHY|nr:hypothetical protein NUW54_g13617 [Trametes sanguinea]